MLDPDVWNMYIRHRLGKVPSAGEIVHARACTSLSVVQSVNSVNMYSTKGKVKFSVQINYDNFECNFILFFEMNANFIFFPEIGRAHV